MVGVIRTKHDDVFRVMVSPTPLIDRGDHVQDPTGIEKGCKPHLFGTRLDRQGALRFVEAMG